jgi:hypothetical protein
MQMKIKLGEGEMAIYKTRREASEGTNPTNTSISHQKSLGL